MLSETRSQIIDNYLRGLKQSNTEAAKKERFVGLLKDFFPEQEFSSFINDFLIGSEKSIKQIFRNALPGTGRADTQYGSVIIEFEFDLKKTGDHAVEQLKEYVSGNWNSNNQADFTLITTDCQTWRIYNIDFETLKNMDNIIHVNDINLNKIDEFIVTSKSADDFWFFLERYLFGKRKIHATLEDIRQAFGAKSSIFSASLLGLHRAYNAVKNNPDMKLAFEQWERFLGIAYANKFQASEETFLVQTYLSIISKMMAYTVLEGKEFISWNDIKHILDGSIFKKFQIANFTDEDFFRWTSDENVILHLNQTLQRLASEVTKIDFSKGIIEDVLKGVYQELVDDDTRHSLGEHYTPDWLCERIVQHIQPKRGNRILDPSCGSGSFLRATATYLINKYKDITANELAQSIYGIDVHPLSVQISKATLILTMGKMLENESSPIYLNVFLANTLLLPKTSITLMGKFYTVLIDNEKLKLNIDFFKNRDIFLSMIDSINKLAEKDYKQKINNDERKNQIYYILSKRFSNETKEIIKNACNLYESLLRAKIRDRDGIWAYILSNSYAPMYLNSFFDIVIGNPPWLTLKDIADNEYQDAVNNLALEYSISSRRGNLRTQLDLSPIFVGHCINHFLKPNGKLAMVMPRAIFNAEQHDPIRKNHIKCTNITEVWDLKDVSPLFKVPSCVLFAEQEVGFMRVFSRVPSRIFSGILKHRNEKISNINIIKEAQGYIYLSKMGEITAWTNNQQIMIGNTSCQYRTKFKNGATLFPRRLCFIELTQPLSGTWEAQLAIISKDSHRKIPVKSSDYVLRDAKAPWKNIGINGSVESRFLFETALANNIIPFSLNGTFITALPFDKDTSLMMDSQTIEMSGDIESANFFSQAEDLWNAKRTKNAKDSNLTYQKQLNLLNKLTSQNLNKRFIVVYNTSGSNLCSAIIDRLDPSINFTFIVEHKCYYFTTSLKDEAFYLCSFLNSSIPNKLIKPFQSEGLLGARDIHTTILEVPIPKFDNKIKEHITLSEIGQKCSNIVNNYLDKLGRKPMGNNLNPIELGRLRGKIRTLISEELLEIDKIVEKILSRYINK